MADIQKLITTSAIDNFTKMVIFAKFSLVNISSEKKEYVFFSKSGFKKDVINYAQSNKHLKLFNLKEIEQYFK